MKIEPPVNINYAAQVIRIPAVVDLQGLDNLVGVPALGHQALTTRGVALGDLAIAFTAETALDPGYASANNLYRDAESNSDKDITGYLDRNGRIRALKLRGHVSNALLMPLSSVEFAGVNWLDLREGDTFDQINGKPICKKYEIARKANTSQKSKIERAFKRVDKKMFPEHLDTDAYWRSKHLLKAGQECIVTQKLHGTSWRGGRVPVTRQLSLWHRFLKRLGAPIPEHEWDSIFGSRKVIKDPKSTTQDHFYDFDLWTHYGKQVADFIPEGMIVYGELIGWVPGTDTPLQKGYTYDVPSGTAELYVYRVAHINAQGHLSDLSWDGVKQFCTARGLKWVPELNRIAAGMKIQERVEEFVDYVMDKRIFDHVEYPGWIPGPLPLQLSDKKTVDEGVCLRQDGIVPLILKAKSPEFLAHETRLLDKGELDLESVA